MVEHHPVIFTPEARRLVSAEGGMGAVLVIAVGPDPPGLDRAAQTVGGVAPPGPDAPANTVGGFVGKGARLLDRLEGGERQDEIRRASGRERVWSDVSCSVVAGTLNIKKTKKSYKQ